MIINSDFKDYYDIMQKHGVDKTVVYNRKQHIFASTEKCPPLDALEKRFREARGYCDHYGDLYFNPGLLGFCGKFYLFYQLQNHSTFNGKEVEGIAYDFADIKKFCGKQYLDGKYLDGSRYLSGNIIAWQSDVLPLSFGKIALWATPEIFQELKTPIFLIRHNGERQLNPILKAWGFQRVLGPAEAYQEIASFVSGVLGQSVRPTVPIGDVDMAAKKGFDKWSFRRHRDDAR
jgi:hypothetical protein